GPNPFITYEDFFPFFTDEALPKRDAYLAKLNTKDRQFNKLMRLAVQADMEYHALYFLYTPRTKHPEKSDYMAFYSDIVTDNKFTDADILELGNGYRWMSFYGQYIGLNREDRPEGTVNYIKAKLSAIQN